MFSFATTSPPSRVFGLMSLWILGLAATGLSAMLILQMTDRVSVSSWDQTGLS
jgi:hypothetical protein